MILELKRKLTESVQKNRTTGLLFSGGLDSAILAKLSPNIKAITVSLESGGEDIKYAASAARFLNIEHYQKSIDTDEAIEAIPEVIKILKTFDPAIPNDLVVYFGLKFAKELGIDEVMTGDGSDEIFAGYSFMEDIKDLAGYTERVSRNMSFSSNVLAESKGLKIRQPYMDKKVVDFALGIPINFKIHRDNGTIWGKWILRKAFEDKLPHQLVWQSKRPLEIGSGMTRLRNIISSRISDSEFERKQKAYPVKFLNKEHLYYYEIYRKEVGEIPAPKETEKACPGCGAGMDVSAFHCKVCGHVLNWRL